MTAQIEPKTWVQCVRAGDAEGFLTLNGVYYVEAIEPAYDRDTGGVVFGCLVLSITSEAAFNPDRFRPLGGNSSHIERKARVSEPA